MLLGATGPPRPGLGQEMGTREGGTPCSCSVGLQAPHNARGDAVAVGGTAWAAEVARAQGLASLPAAAKWGFWAWPGSAVCTKEEALGSAHRTVFQFVTSFVSLIHLGALFAVGNSFRQFLLLLLMLTMVGTCLLLDFISAQPRSRGRLCVQPSTCSGPLAFAVRMS